MAAEYSYVPVQTVAIGERVAFLNFERACKKGYVTHRSGSGLFKLKGIKGCCETTYKVSFNGNIAVPTDGTPGDISLAITEDGEALGNATATVTVPLVERISNVSMSTFVTVPCNCCVSVTVRNVSAGTALNVSNANITFEQV